MQNLSVISVNFWQIVISLVNLLILTWIIKRFLYKPVKKMMDARRATIDEYYAQAQAARDQAEESRLNYESAMAAAQQTSDQIIADANRTAEFRSNEILAEARERASEIRRQAEVDAVLEEFAPKFGIPVYRDFPFGHSPRCYTLDFSRRAVIRNSAITFPAVEASGK